MGKLIIKITLQEENLKEEFEITIPESDRSKYTYWREKVSLEYPVKHHKDFTDGRD